MKCNDKIKKGKVGVNYVTTVIDRCGCNFNKIEQENDIGIDGIIEIIYDGVSTGKCIAVQVKTGASYVDKEKQECKIPIGNHYDYWKNYSMPVYGIVFNLDENIAYWVDIKKYLEANEDKLNTIKFKMKYINKFDIESFNNYFKYYVTNRLPNLSYEEAIYLLDSDDEEEIYIAINVLGKKYACKIEIWQKFINLFRQSNNYDLLEELIVYFSYVPRHGDLFGDLNFSGESKKYAKQVISELKVEDIIKLLGAIDENGIDRGTIGQCVEAIISSIDNNDEILKKIINNEDLDENIKNNAINIFAYKYPDEFIRAISKNEIKKNWYIELVEESFNKYGGFDLY